MVISSAGTIGGNSYQRPPKKGKHCSTKGTWSLVGPRKAGKKKSTKQFHSLFIFYLQPFTGRIEACNVSWCKAFFPLSLIHIPDLKRENLGIRIIKGSLFAAFIHKWLNTVYKKLLTWALQLVSPLSTWFYEKKHVHQNKIIDNYYKPECKT